MSNEAESATFDATKTSITTILVTQGSIKTEDSFFDKPTFPARTNVSVASNFGFNREAKKVRIIIKVSFFAIGEDDNPVGISGEYEVHFEMSHPDLDKFIKLKENGAEAFEKGVAASMVGIAYSTSRGVILERTLGTTVGGVVLPVIDPSILLSPKPFHMTPRDGDDR